MLVSQAWAESTAPVAPTTSSTATATTATTGSQSAAAPDMLMSFAPLLLIFGIFYFLIIRPQQKKMQEHQKMVNALTRGDKVITGGGLVATVIRADEGDQEITLEIAEGVRVKAMRGTITLALNTAEAANNNGASGKKALNG